MSVTQKDTVRVGDVVLRLVCGAARNKLVDALVIDLVVASVQVEWVRPINIPVGMVSVGMSMTQVRLDRELDVHTGRWGHPCHLHKW